MSPEGVRPTVAADGMPTPRRQVLRTMSAAGAAVLGILGLSAAAPARKAKGEKKKKKNGAAGPAGPVGQPGPPGPPGAAAAISIVLGPEILFSVPDGSLGEGKAPCPDGAVALGPIFLLYNSGCHVSASNPVRVTSWALEVLCPNGQSSPDNTLRAVCLHGAGMA